MLGWCWLDRAWEHTPDSQVCRHIATDIALMSVNLAKTTNLYIKMRSVHEFLLGEGAGKTLKVKIYNTIFAKRPLCMCWFRSQCSHKTRVYSTVNTAEFEQKMCEILFELHNASNFRFESH